MKFYSNKSISSEPKKIFNSIFKTTFFKSNLRTRLDEGSGLFEKSFF